MSRGRLIFPFLAGIHQLDTAATAADPDGAGPLTSGYDDDFKEPVTVSDASRTGISARKEKTEITLPVQVEDDVFVQLNALLTGNSPDSSIVLVFHFRDLEREGYVDGAGMATIRQGDRLGAIYETNGDLVQTIPNPPGLFVTSATPEYGLGRKRNLLMVKFQTRQQGQRVA